MKFIIGTALLGIVFLRCESELIQEPKDVGSTESTKELHKPAHQINTKNTWDSSDTSRIDSRKHASAIDSFG